MCVCTFEKSVWVSLADVDMKPKKRAKRTNLFDDDLSVQVNGAVVNHAHYGHAQIAPDTERDAEPEAAHDGDDVAARKSKARTVAQRSLFLFGLGWPSIFG